MKKKWMKKWVKDLRDNPDKQGYGYLQDPKSGKNCCLGRAMILCNWKFEYGQWNGPDNEVFRVNATATLPYAVQEKMGLGLNYADVRMEDIQINEVRTADFSGLAEANDDGVSFAKIADWIEENYKRL